jgi:transcriptional regulator with XRE-family HTH domain
MNIGLILSKLIEDRNVKKTQLAKYLDVARNTLDDYLSERTYMTTEKLEKVANFFKVPVSYFFEDTPNGNITQTGKDHVTSKGEETKASVVIPQDVLEQISHLTQTVMSQQQTIDYLCKKITGDTAAIA